MKKVDCPLMGEAIDDVICFDIHMVVEGARQNLLHRKRLFKRRDTRKFV